MNHTKSGQTVRLTYPVQSVPYLGIWEGIMNGVYVTALEPCTGAYDSLDTALEWKRIRAIPPKSTYRWYLQLSCELD